MLKIMNIKEEWWISNGWTKLQMKKFLEESEKEEPVWRVWRWEEVRWWGTCWDTGDCLGDDILEGKRRGRGRPRLKYFEQIIRDMGCKTFREVKQLAGDIHLIDNGDRWLHQTSLKTVHSMMMILLIIIYYYIPRLGKHFGLFSILTLPLAYRAEEGL